MSWRVIYAIRECPDLGGSRMLVAMTFATYADDDGGSVFPSIPTIADKAGLCERTVQTHLRGLEADGYMVMVKPAGRYRAAEYRFDMDAIKGASVAPMADAMGASDDAMGASDDAMGASDDTPYRKNHQLPDQGKETRARVEAVDNARGEAGSEKLEKVLASLDPDNPCDQRMAALIYGRNPELKEKGERG